MSESLDKEKVIVSLTDGIGHDFGRAARRSFYDQLERLERNGSFIEASRKEQQALVDILAVASFYQNVIVPVESSAAFIGVVESAGATHLRVAGDKLDRTFARRSGTIAEHFRWLLQQARIPEALLTYPTLSKFISRAKAELYRPRTDGTMD